MTVRAGGQVVIGADLRDAGYEQVMLAASAAHRGAGDHIRDAIDALAASGEHFTADDVRALLPADVEPHSPNLLPAYIGSAARNRLIRCVGMAKPGRASRRASRILVWEGVA